MFNIIGKRRWYFLFSALVTLPGLFFIFLAPLVSKDAGLQFTIDYTGGTKWEIRFERPGVTAEQVRAVFADNGLEAFVLSTGDGFFEIKTEPIGLQPPAPSPTPAPTIAPSGSAGASAGASASAGPSASAAAPSASAAASAAASPSASPSPSPSPPSSASPAPSASASPAASSSPGASPGASPSASPGAVTGNTELPTDGQLGEMVTALEAALGPIESQRSLTTIGPVTPNSITRRWPKLR